VLEPEWLETAPPSVVERNLRDIVRTVFDVSFFTSNSAMNFSGGDVKSEL
jgi:hypothetical protein